MPGNLNKYAGAEIRTQEPTKGVGFPNDLELRHHQSALNDLPPLTTWLPLLNKL